MSKPSRAGCTCSRPVTEALACMQSRQTLKEQNWLPASVALTAFLRARSCSKIKDFIDSKYFTHMVLPVQASTNKKCTASAPCAFSCCLSTKGHLQVQQDLYPVTHLVRAGCFSQFFDHHSAIKIAAGDAATAVCNAFIGYKAAGDDASQQYGMVHLAPKIVSKMPALLEPCWQIGVMQSAQWSVDSQAMVLEQDSHTVASTR